MEDFAATAARLAKLKNARANRAQGAASPRGPGTYDASMVNPRATPTIGRDTGGRSSVELGMTSGAQSRQRKGDQMFQATDLDTVIREDMARTQRERDMRERAALDAEATLKADAAQASAEQRARSIAADEIRRRAVKQAEDRRRAEGGDPSAGAFDAILNNVSAQQDELRKYSETRGKSDARRSTHEASGSKKRTAMIFTLPPRLGVFKFNEPGRRLLLLRNVRFIDLSRQGFEYQTVVICMFTDIAFIADRMEEGLFELRHRPQDRAQVSASEAPAVYGPKAIKAMFGNNEFLLETSGPEEAKWWLKRLNQYSRF